MSVQQADSGCTSQQHVLNPYFQQQIKTNMDIHPHSLQASSVECHKHSRASLQAILTLKFIPSASVKVSQAQFFMNHTCFKERNGTLWQSCCWCSLKG